MTESTTIGEWRDYVCICIHKFDLRRYWIR